MKAIIPQCSRIIVEPIPHEDTKIIEVDGFKDDEGEEITHFPRWRVVAIGGGRLLDDGRIVKIDTIEVGDEVVIDPRFAIKLDPPGFYDGRKLWAIDYFGGVICKVEREPGEKVSRFAIPKPKPQQPPQGILVSPATAAQLAAKRKV